MKLADELGPHVESLQLSDKDSDQFFNELVENLEIASIIGNVAEVDFVYLINDYLFMI